MCAEKKIKNIWNENIDRLLSQHVESEKRNWIGIGREEKLIPIDKLMELLAIVAHFANRTKETKHFAMMFENKTYI